MIISEQLKKEFEEIRDRFPEPSSALIPILHRVQEVHGYVSDEAIHEVAAFMGMTSAEVEGVTSFYTLFHRKPVGKYVIHVCHSISCMLMGGDSLLEMLQRKLGIEIGETTKDGLFTLETAECLAACGFAPMLQINLKYFYDVTEAKVDRILASLRKGEELVGEVLPTIGGGSKALSEVSRRG